MAASGSIVYSQIHGLQKPPSAARAGNPREQWLLGGKLHQYRGLTKIRNGRYSAISGGSSRTSTLGRTVTARASQAVEVKPRVSADLVEKCINTIRILTVDSVNNAKAGHPGAAMGLAPVGYVLWDEAMRYNPANPLWFNRDRFLLSVGHAVLLQYILLHLTGFDLAIDDLKKLAQCGSKTPGHPERLLTPGIEVVTGALGQGVANAVGLAVAEKHLAARFNMPDAQVVDHYTYVIFGDGCAMEGITNEAASLAGHYKLGKLIAFYDKNSNTIDGGTDLSITEDVGKRHVALNWHVQTIPISEYGNAEAIRNAVTNAKKETQRPSLIVVETTIGYGSPSKAGTPKAHHGAFGDEESAKIRKQLKWDHDEMFYVPPEVYEETRKQLEHGAKAEAEWNDLVTHYKQQYPERGREFDGMLNGQLPVGWEEALPRWTVDDKPDATRGYSEKVLNALAAKIPGLIGGSADLAGSNKAYLHDMGDFHVDPKGRNMRYGVREHAMASISNGIACHSRALIPFAATFLIFTDYGRAGLRLGALQHAQVLWITTHDSLGLGEDGPTHQPVEHLPSLRAMPNLLVFRPGDGNEVSAAYKVALSRRDGPTLIALSRQKLEAQLEGSSIEHAEKGAYVLQDSAGESGPPDLILIGTGSETLLCVRAAEQLHKEGKRVRVVSMPSWELFEEQSEAYRESVLPPTCLARLSVECASPLGWREWIGPKGKALGVTKFGASGPYLDVFKAYGFTIDNIVETAKRVMAEQ